MSDASVIERSPLPDYLPARMLNEFVYCPRLFYYEWVEGVFVHNRETTEGALRHSKIDAKQDSLPLAESLQESGDAVHSRSVELASDEHGLIAKCDLVETEGNVVTPVDYKRGRPREGAGGAIEAWDADAVQICVQALVLRANGYQCNEGVIYYATTKQRVRVPISDELVATTLSALEKARETAASHRIPPPLVDSPKCPRCSLVGICLPDETVTLETEFNTPRRTQRTLFEIRSEPTSSLYNGDAKGEIRRLTPARDDLRPLYLNTQGLYVGKSGKVLKVKEKDKVVEEIRLHDICQLNLMGNIQLSTQAVQTLCEHEIPIAYFSMGGWFYGITNGLGPKNVYLRKEQFRLAESPSFCLRLSRAITAGKIKNQRTMLQRNHVEPPREALNMLRCMQEQAETASSLESLLGIEGNAARVYFENFAGMIKSEPDPFAGDDKNNGKRTTKSDSEFNFDFEHRNRRPPRDPVNALLSLAYSLLSKDLTIVCQMVGFDPFLGFYHQPRFGRAPLALDLMEPFRPLIADSAVLSAINTRMVTASSFVRVGPSVALTPEGRKAFFRAYEQRMDSLVTHPLFGYRLNYRRMLEVQTRLLARVMLGELDNYPVFTTR